MFNVREENVSTLSINDFYRISKEVYRELVQIEDFKQRIENCYEADIEIVKSINGQFKDVIKRYMTMFLPYEVKHKKHVAIMSMQEIKDMIYEITSVKKFTSMSVYFHVCNSIFLINKWGYYSLLREDYYTVSDLTRVLDSKELVNELYCYTIKDIRTIAREVSGIDAKIAILAATEGIKQSELCNIKRSQFEDDDNRKIDLGTREVYMSNRLYMLCIKYSIMKYTSEAKIGESDKLLSTTEYLIRGADTTRQSNTNNKDVLRVSRLSGRVKKELDKIGIDASIATFRNSSILYEICKGKSIEYINHKYGTKYFHKRVFMKDKELENAMIEKIREESLDN